MWQISPIIGKFPQILANFPTYWITCKITCVTSGYPSAPHILLMVTHRREAEYWPSNPLLKITFQSKFWWSTITKLMTSSFTRPSFYAQWTTAAWSPQSSGSTPPRTTSPSPSSRLRPPSPSSGSWLSKSSDSGLTRGPPRPPHPLGAALPLRHLLLCRRECSWTGILIIN